MQESALALTEQRESSFVNRCRANRPSVADVELLNSLVGQIAEARQVRSPRLKSRKRFLQIVLGEVVVAAQALILRELVVNLKRGLIGALMPERYRLKSTVSPVGKRDKLIQQIKCSLVKTCRRHLAVGKNGSIGSPVRNRSAAQRGKAAGTVVQNIGIREGSSKLKCPVSAREVTVALQLARDCNCIRRSALPNTVAFIGYKEKGFVFLDGPTQSGTELILQVVELRGIKEAFGIEILVAEEFIRIAVDFIAAGFRHHVDDCARVPAVFGIKCIG